MPPEEVPLALVRRPGPELERCELTHLARTRIDLERAREQHAQYAAALVRLGFDVRALPELPEQPDATFVEDVALLLPQIVVALRPGAASRRGEVKAIRPELEQLVRGRPLEQLAAACHVDGGDLLLGDGVLYVGQSSRTNHAGLKALAHLLLEHGYRVKAAPVEGCLHLETACTFLDGERLLVNPAWVDLAHFPALERIEVHPDEPFAANALVRGRRVLLSASHPRMAERLTALGYEVLAVELSEFEKAEGGPTCLSLVTRGL